LVELGKMNEVDSGKRFEESLTEALESIKSRNLEATEYWIVARITGFESADYPLLPGSSAYELTTRSGTVKPAVRYGGSFWDVEKYVIEANQERETKMQFPFSLATTEAEKTRWLKDFRMIVDAKASKAADDIRQGLGVPISHVMLTKIKRIERT